ncbi:hypothetical protein D9M72_433190 [compost metagenome]
MASISVFTTSWMEPAITGEVSYGNTTFIPGGKKGSSPSSVLRMARTVSSALAPAASRTAMPEAAWPLYCALML